MCIRDRLSLASLIGGAAWHFHRMVTGHGLCSQMVPEVFFRLIHASIPGSPHQEMHVKLAGQPEKIINVGLPVGNIDKTDVWQGTLKTCCGLQAAQPFVALFILNGSLFAGMAFAKILCLPSSDLMVGQPQGYFLRGEE